MKKLNFKIIILIVLLVIVSIVGIIIIAENGEKQFKEIAHICNNLCELPGMQVTSPKILNIWYFEEEDHAGKDVIVCFTGENTSSKYYQYFMWIKGMSDFINVCYAKDEVHTSNIIMANEFKNSESQFKLQAATLIFNAMETGNRIEDNQIKKINKLLNNGKIEKYKDYKIIE